MRTPLIAFTAILFIGVALTLTAFLIGPGLLLNLNDVQMQLHYYREPSSLQANPIIRENTHQGTTTWRIPPGKEATVEIQAYAGAIGDQPSVVEGYRVGGWMRYLEGDFWSMLGAVQLRGRPEAPPPARAVLDFCTSFFMPTGYDYLDWKDPLPAWRATANFAHKVTQQVKKRIAKRISM